MKLNDTLHTFLKTIRIGVNSYIDIGKKKVCNPSQKAEKILNKNNGNLAMLDKEKENEEYNRHIILFPNPIETLIK